MTALVRLPFRASDAYRARLDGCERGARERLARIEGSTPASDTARMMANASVAYASMMRDYSTRVGELFSRLDDRRRNSQQSAAALDAIASPVVTIEPLDRGVLAIEVETVEVLDPVVLAPTLTGPRTTAPPATRGVEPT